jgi:ABC transporter substrate binding protein
MIRRAFIAGLGGMVARPWIVRAQQASRSYKLSYLALTPGEDATLMKMLLERLNELGYRENLIFEYRCAEGDRQQLAPLAIELVQNKPDVLVAGFGTLAAQAAKAATTTIPIVFTTWAIRLVPV